MAFFEKIFKSKIFKSLVLVSFIGIGLIFLVSLYLKAYTHHGQKIFTPSFKGLNIEDAIELADDKNIKIKIIDSVYEAYGEPGTVIDQTPKMNFMIKEGRTIFVTIKAKGQKMVTMPDLRSVSLMQARSLIESSFLKIGYIEYQPSTFNNLVIEQKVDGKVIEPKTSLPAGTKIDLIVGKKEGNEAIVPDFIGLFSDDAAFKAAEHSLNIGKIIYDNTVLTDKDTAEAVVWKQSINKGNTVEYGAKIDIYMTVEPEKY